MTEEDAGTSVAEAFLVSLANRGVSYLFGNAGTDWAPVIEALARVEKAGGNLPTTLPIAHESVAMGMAHGYYLMTGEPQAVMVHVNVGLANAAMATLNAARARVPIILAAGMTPVTEHGRLGSRNTPIHWGQDMFDQTSLVREAVKWHRELHAGEQVGDAVDRALAIASTAPKGPVYLGLPRETLAESVGPTATAPPASLRLPSTAYPGPDALEEAAEMLDRAEHPVIISSAGSPSLWKVLDPFAEAFAVPVVQFWPTRLAMRTTHPYNAGGDPTELLRTADVVLVLDALVPWLPHKHELRADHRVIMVSVDPLYADVPMRTFAADVSLTTSPDIAVSLLDERLRGLGTDLARATVQRRERIAERLGELRDSRRPAPPDPPGEPMSPAFVSSRITAVLDDPVVVNELGCVPDAMDLRRADSYFGVSLAGGLGWGMPASLGIKLADRTRLVVNTIGDGSYMFGNPAACHQTAAQLDLPILTIVFDNRGWGAVRRSTLDMYPDGDAASTGPVMPMSVLGGDPDYVALAAAFGGYGESVTEAAELDGALRRARDKVLDEACQALLHVRVRPRA